MGKTVVASIVLLVGALLACKKSDPPPPPAATSAQLDPDLSRIDKPSGRVTAADFGDAWPFTVPEGTLFCSNGAGQPVVMMTTEKERYAINGNARELVDGQAIKDLKEIRKPNMSVQPIIDRGLALCSK